MSATDSAERESLRQLLIDHLRCLHDIQIRRAGALSDLGKQARSVTARETYHRGIASARQQIRLLGSVLARLGDDTPSGEIAGASFHYEIANYATARMWAQHLGLDHISELLRLCIELDQRSVIPPMKDEPVQAAAAPRQRELLMHAPAQG